MKRAALLPLALALAACGDEPISYIGFGDAGAPCSTAGGESACGAAPTCSKIGECCTTDASGGCLTVCQGCCNIDDTKDPVGFQSFQCIKTGGAK